VRADGHTVWSRKFEHQLERITLDSGTLAIRVDHARSTRRLLVLLPDGELEDIGTAFIVSVDTGRTTRVTVEEGSVILRLRGKAPLVLRAGDGWTHDAAPPVASSDSTAARSAPAAPSAVPVATPSGLSRPKAAPGVRAAAPPPPSGTAAVASAPDLRAEDAAYLRVIALQRAGDAPAMQRAVRDYLRRFPRGFRRVEVEQLAQ
jgi:hypothetical protein